MTSADTATLKKDYKKLVTIGILNMAQTFPAAFTGTALPFLFRKEGLPLEMFWLLALPTMPTWLRWLMALAVDNFGSERFGHRKSWIVPCTLVGTAAYALLAFIPPSLPALHLIVAILLFKAFVMVAQDVTIDAYAAESMTSAERGGRHLDHQLARWNRWCVGDGHGGVGRDVRLAADDAWRSGADVHRCNPGHDPPRATGAGGA